MDASARAALLGVAFVVAGCSARESPGVERVEATVGSEPSNAVRSGEAHPSSCRAPLGLDVVPIGEGRSGSTVVLARVHGRLLSYLADEDASVVRVVDVDSARELASVPMPGHPARMLMLPGGRLAVTLRDHAKVALFTPSPLEDAGLDPLCSLETSDEPVDLAATPDRKTLLALSEWGHTLAAFDLDAGKPRFEVDLPRAPRAVLASADGAHAYVAHAAGRQMSSIDLRSATPVAEPVELGGQSNDRETFFEMLMPPIAFDLLDDEAPSDGRVHRRHLRRPPPSPPTRTRQRSACQGFALADLGGKSGSLFAPMVEVVTSDLEIQSSGYGPGAATTTAELPVVAIVDETTGKPDARSLVATEPAGSSPPPCLLPRAATASRGSLYVACQGIDAIVEYDVSSGGAKTPEVRRWSVPPGPSGIAIHGDRAVVWSQFGGEASILSLARDSKVPPLAVAVRHLPRTPDEETIALGRVLFHRTSDRRISSDGRACASCHPDGRDDGLVWSTPGGPRQTPMLAGRVAETAPYGWDGAGSDLVHHIGHTFARLEGDGLPPQELDAVVRYLGSLEGPPVQARAEPSTLARGRDVFFATGCGSCHAPESGFTDGQSHDVHSRATADARASFDTPSLRFAAGTAPYFHDGRFATLQTLLASKDSPMGAARDRSKEDRDALEVFVRSL